MKLCHISCIPNISTLSAFFCFYDVCSVRTKFLPIRSGKISVFRTKFAYFRAPPLVVCVPTTSPNREVFEPKLTCPFRGQLVPFSSPDRASFEPKKILFRAQIVPISSPNRTSFELFSCCYRALSCCVHLSTGC